MDKKVMSAGYSHFSRLDYFKIYQNKQEYFNEIRHKLQSKEFDGSNSIEQIQSYFYQMIFDQRLILVKFCFLINQKNIDLNSFTKIK